jgi:hypothetical protein
VQDVKIEHGELDMLILQSTSTYFTHTDGGATVHPLASSTSSTRQ